MSGCLACKACATQCPVRVDVPDFRAQFLELYHRRYARPLGDYLTALLERMLPFLARAPRLANALMGNALGRWWTARVAGITDAPLLDSEPAAKRLAHHGIPIAPLADLERLSKDARVVVVLQDAFTTFYEPAVLEASCLLLRALGFQPHVLPYFENGKALHVKGFLRAFGRVVARNTELLRRVASLGFPLVGISPPSSSRTETNTRRSWEPTPASAYGFCKSGSPSRDWEPNQPLGTRRASAFCRIARSRPSSPRLLRNGQRSSVPWAYPSKS